MGWISRIVGSKSDDTLEKVHDRSLSDSAATYGMTTISVIEKGRLRFKKDETPIDDLNEHLQVVQLEDCDGEYAIVRLKRGYDDSEQETLDRDLLFLSYGGFQGLNMDTSGLSIESAATRQM